MISNNPFGEFRQACESAMKTAFAKAYPEIQIDSVLLDVPSNPEFGELTSSVFFELSKKLPGVKPPKLATRIASSIDVQAFPLIRAVQAAGAGYVNFHANFSQLSRTTIESVRTLKKTYGCITTEHPAEVIVEHTSSNPMSPIHIGQARNPILGDSLARLLQARGHKVSRHFYVDDVGRQTAVVAYGYQVLGHPHLEGKPDQILGVIYSLTSCLIEINRLKRALTCTSTLDAESIQKLHTDLDEWASVAVELEKKHPKLFNQLLEETDQSEDLENLVNDLNRAYEAGDEKSKKLIRDVCQLSLAGIKETLTRAEVLFDSWDWESDFIWNGSVTKMLADLKKSGYVFSKGPVLEFDANKVAEDLSLKNKLGIRDDYEVPSLTLVRADGTTLYTTRDISYTLWKFKKADKVINVVGMEQKLPQQQLKLALHALRHDDKAMNLTHFAYNLVSLPGYRMSSRRGRYITFDEVIDESIKRAYREVEKRSPQLPDDEKQKISHIVGLGALKYALVEVDPAKPVEFTWERVLDFERNSAPYIQYSHARARSIIRKAEQPEHQDYSLLETPLERDLVLELARFPETVINSADNLKPNAIADYANTLADKFNSFYNSLPVIKAEPRELSDARLALVEAISMVLQNSLQLIGVTAPERM